MCDPIFIKKQHRSQPIPKEVNKFIIENYGALYYNCKDLNERIGILQQIEEKLKESGYGITGGEVERRLKNMKSHFRRKKAEMKQGLVSSVEWEYFKALDAIFVEKESSRAEELPIIVPAKRKSEPIEQPVEDIKPQDLSIKRPKIIEFNHRSDLTSQIPVRATEATTQTDECSQAKQLMMNKVIESIASVDHQRLILDQQRVGLEIRRYELDVIGYQLSDLLSKLSQSSG